MRLTHILRNSAAILTLSVSAAVTASGQTVITFEEFAADNHSGAIPLNRYLGFGVQFVGTDGATWGGNSAGNPSLWGLEGTNGPRFSGFNSSYTQTLNFTSLINGFSLDVSRSTGSLNGTFTLSGYLGTGLIATNTVQLGQINSWSTIAVAGQFDRVVYSGAGTGYHPFGVDNLQFNTSVVPEPASWAMLIAGLGVIGVAQRRRRTNGAA